MGALYGIDVGDDLGVGTTATSYDDIDGIEPEGVPGLDEVVAPVGDYLDLIADAEVTATVADATVLADPAVVRHPHTVDARYAHMAVEDHIAIEGKAFAVTDLVLRIRPTLGVEGISALETYPDPEVAVVDAQARWLPLQDRFPARLRWFPFSINGSEDRQVEGGQSFTDMAEVTWDALSSQSWVTFAGVSTVVTGGQGDLTWYSSAGATPTISSSYTYVRGGGFVTGPAMVVRGGQYMFSDSLAWETDQFTVLAVCVLRAPRGKWYSVVDSTPTLVSTEDPISLRYHGSGILALWMGSALGEIRIQSGFARPNQPVIVGFTVNFADLTASMFAVDTATHYVSAALPQRPSLRPRLYLGYSKMGGSSATMEILEVDYWTAVLSEDAVVQRMALLDRIYGVSTS